MAGATSFNAGSPVYCAGGETIAVPNRYGLHDAWIKAASAATIATIRNIDLTAHAHWTNIQISGYAGQYNVLDGSIGEFLLFDTPPDVALIAAAEEYLAAKYGVL